MENGDLVAQGPTSIGNGDLMAWGPAGVGKEVLVAWGMGTCLHGDLLAWGMGLDGTGTHQHGEWRPGGRVIGDLEAQAPSGMGNGDLVAW